MYVYVLTSVRETVVAAAGFFPSSSIRIKRGGGKKIITQFACTQLGFLSSFVVILNMWVTNIYVCTIPVVVVVYVCIVGESGRHV